MFNLNHKTAFYIVGIAALAAIAIFFVQGGLSTQVPIENSKTISVQESSSLNSSSLEVSVQENTFKGSGSELVTNKVDSIDLLVDGLKAKLENNPGDMKGWVLLAKSYHYLQRWDESAEAYGKAKELGYEGEEADFSVKDGSSSVAVSGGDNQNQSASPMDGMMFAAIKDITDKESSPASLTVSVSLDPSLAERLSPNSLIFIFVKAAAKDNTPASGPPLAVVKKQAGELPLTLSLNDSMAMLPGHTMSSASQVFVSARVSMNGDPIKQFNDIEKVVGPISARSKDLISIVIGGMNDG